MPLRVLAGTVGIIQGGWMVFDGLHVLSTGRYFGPVKPGPWSDLVSSLGVDPYRLGGLFVGLGTEWLLSSFALLLLRAEGWPRIGLAVAAAGSLWYLPVGTVLSLLTLGLLGAERRARPG